MDLDGVNSPLIVLAANSSFNIVNFRMELIRRLEASGYRVQVLAPGAQAAMAPHSVAGEDLPVDRSGLNPIRDLALLGRLRSLLTAHQAAALLSFTVKPNYGWVGSDFVFASELKALRAHPDFAGEIDRRAVRSFLSRTYIPAPLSIYRRIFKLMPGTVMTITGGIPPPLDDAPPIAGSGPLRLAKYWDYEDVVRDGLAEPYVDEDEALESLERALSDAIRDQSVADVPVGAFLSGGIDSSTVVALYQAVHRKPVRTYTIGYAESGFDESVHAGEIARHLGTEHHEHHVTVREARDVIPLLPTI